LRDRSRRHRFRFDALTSFQPLPGSGERFGNLALQHVALGIEHCAKPTPKFAEQSEPEHDLSMTLRDLMDYVQLPTARVRHRYASNPSEGEAILNCLGMAITHLDSARFGAKLYCLPHSTTQELQDLFTRLGEDHFTLESASNNLVFRGVVTSLDLCGAAIWRVLCSSPKSEFEAHIGWWQTKEGKALRHTGDPRFVTWIDNVLGSHEWSLLKEGRDKLTHRVVPRHVISGGSIPPKGVRRARPASTEIELLNNRYDLLALHPDLVDFGTGKWKDVCDLLAL
jgi:hypothetical protein